MPFSQISHPRPLPQSPKDCSLHLCLFCCLAYRVVVTIFLIFLKRSLVFPVVLFSSISLHLSLRRAFLSLLAILWNKPFKSSSKEKTKRSCQFGSLNGNSAYAFLETFLLMCSDLSPLQTRPECSLGDSYTILFYIPFSFFNILF